jgi:hypothetical protein
MGVVVDLPRGCSYRGPYRGTYAGEMPACTVIIKPGTGCCASPLLSLPGAPAGLPESFQAPRRVLQSYSKRPSGSSRFIPSAPAGLPELFQAPCQRVFQSYSRRPGGSSRVIPGAQAGLPELFQSPQRVFQPQRVAPRSGACGGHLRGRRTYWFREFG